MPIRGLPNGARNTHPQAGRDRPEWVVAINRNGWSRSIVTGGRNQSERVVAIVRCAHSAAAQAALATILDEAKQSGVVQKAIDAKGLRGVNVATK